METAGPKLKCCFDFNTAIGQNLTEKVQSLYMAMRRMQLLAERDGPSPNILVVSPLVLALFEITNTFKACDLDPIPECPYKPTGTVFWGRWRVYVDESTYQEHHLFMTALEDKKLPPLEKQVQISLLNFVMSNLFGYYNMP